MGVRVFIIGSCVSRDIFNFDRDRRFELVDYYARSSLAVLPTPPYFNEEVLDRIPSAFQRRMVKRDFLKTILDESLLDQADIILLDLIDERFDLISVFDNFNITASSELISTGILRDNDLLYRLIKPGTEERKQFWINGVRLLFQHLEQRDLLRRVIVNKVFWADKFDEDEMNLTPFNPASVLEANRTLNWMYKILNLYLDDRQFMEFDDGIFRSNTLHQWGPSPFHYVDDYYKSALIQLENLNCQSIFIKNPDLKEVIATRMDRITDDFLPFDESVNFLGNTVNLPLFTGEEITISLNDGIQWNQNFARQSDSSVMWLFSLATLGRILSTFKKTGNAAVLKFAAVSLNSFFDYSRLPDVQMSLGKIPSADHSAATRVRVLIKFIQVMRDCPDVDFLLLSKVFELLKYWSDWLLDPKNYIKCNHGLMGSISLIHSSLQFGSMPYAKTYLETATQRIIELAESSFDRDGLCNENTIGYHNFNLHLYRGLLAFLKHYEISETTVRFLEDLIRRGEHALQYCIWQDGSIPPIGDSPVYRLTLTSKNESKCFYDSGFAVVKNNDLYLSVLCGAPTEIHKQVDDSSITLRFRNRDILVDGGSYLYDRKNPYRRCIESSYGHSGIFLKGFDGLLRSEFLRKFGPIFARIDRFEESDQGVRIRCTYSTKNGDARFWRDIFVCWPDEVAVVDLVEINDMSAMPNTVQRFLFGPMIEAQMDGANKVILKADDFACSLFQIRDCESSLYRGEEGEVVRGWCSYKYKEIFPVYAVDFECKSKVSQFATIIKLSSCETISECSPEILAFANGRDPFFD